MIDDDVSVLWETKSDNNGGGVLGGVIALASHVLCSFVRGLFLRSFVTASHWFFVISLSFIDRCVSTMDKPTWNGHETDIQGQTDKRTSQSVKLPKIFDPFLRRHQQEDRKGHIKDLKMKKREWMWNWLTVTRMNVVMDDWLIDFDDEKIAQRTTSIIIIITKQRKKRIENP